MGDAKHHLEEVGEQVPADLRAHLRQLQTAEGDDASNIADDIRFGFDGESLGSAPSVIRLVAAIASERPRLQQTRVFSIFSTLAGYIRPEMPASLQANITRELKAVTPMLADVVEGDQATTAARQAWDSLASAATGPAQSRPFKFQNKNVDFRPVAVIPIRA